MRLTPTSLERIFFLLLILAFMAWLVPESWRSSRWAGNEFAKANAHFDDRGKISVIEIEEKAKIAPDEFKQFRLELREKCIEEYLGRGDE